MQIQNELQHYSNILAEMKSNELSVPIMADSEGDELAPYFQIALMSEVSDALQRLLADGTVQHVLNAHANLSQWRISDAKTVDSIIRTIINLPDEKYPRMKGSCQYSYYIIAGIYGVIALYALFHVVAALIAMQFTLYTLLCGAALIVAPLGALACLARVNQITKDFSLLEQVSQESDPKINFSAEFVSANGQKIPCKLSAHQLAQGFFSSVTNNISVAEAAFEEFQRTFRQA